MVEKFREPRKETLYNAVGKVLKKEKVCVLFFRKLAHPLEALVFSPEVEKHAELTTGLSLQIEVQEGLKRGVSGLLLLCDQTHVDRRGDTTKWGNSFTPGILQGIHAAFWLCENAEEFPTLVSGDQKLYFGVWYPGNKIYLAKEVGVLVSNIVRLFHSKPVNKEEQVDYIRINREHISRQLD